MTNKNQRQVKWKKEVVLGKEQEVNFIQSKGLGEIMTGRRDRNEKLLMVISSRT